MRPRFVTRGSARRLDVLWSREGLWGVNEGKGEGKEVAAVNGSANSASG